MSKTIKQFSVESDFSTSDVPGLSVPQISRRLGVSEWKKFCRRIGNPFGSNDNANDREMLSVDGKVKITRSGYYVVNFSQDLSSLGTIYNSALNVNGTIVRQSYLSSAYGFTRNSSPASYASYLNSGDLLSLSTPDGWTLNNTSGTFIEALEIS